MALKFALIIGDEGKISIGSNSNLQDGTVVCSATSSISGSSADTIIGNNVTIGHNATLRACSIADASLIGMDATLLEGVQVSPSIKLLSGVRQTWELLLNEHDHPFVDHFVFTCTNNSLQILPLFMWAFRWKVVHLLQQGLLFSQTQQ
jgi:NDP-sugar pyrophosphorylase family protein